MLSIVEYRLIVGLSLHEKQFGKTKDDLEWLIQFMTDRPGHFHGSLQLLSCPSIRLEVPKCPDRR